MKIMMNKSTIIALLIGFAFQVNAQEVLFDLQTNPLLFSKQTTTEKSIINNQDYFPIDTIDLPVVDDFSGDKFKRYYNWEYSDSLDMVICNGDTGYSLNVTKHYYYILDTVNNNTYASDTANAVLDTTIDNSLNEFVFCNPYVLGDKDTAFFFPPVNYFTIYDTTGNVLLDTLVRLNTYWTTIKSTHIFTAIRFTVGGNYLDSIHYSPDTTFHYFLLDTNLTDTIGGISDSSVALPSFQVEFYNGSNPFIPNDTVNYWLPFNIYETLDSLGNHVPNSDSMVTIQYTSLVNYYDSVYIRESEHGDKTVWIDNYAFRNSTYPIYPPSIGVATLDGVDETGMPYEFVTGLPEGIADHLTSKPINLEPYEPTDTSLYLSFYYQPQGRGNAPEQNDSLILQFRTSTIDWTNIWNAEGDELPADSAFKQVMINVGSSWFDKGFQFRFMNYATLSGNVDHWHIDYVRFNNNRHFDDTSSNDVSFVFPIHSLLKNYESMPLSHFVIDSAGFMSDSLIVAYHNLHYELKNTFSKWEVFNEFSSISDYLDTLGAKNIPPFTICYNIGTQCEPSDPSAPMDPYFDYTYYSNSSDRAEFDVVVSLVTNPDTIKTNDTLRYKQVFHNYYAYDDGTAENGYGLEIQSPVGVSMAAYRFKMAKEDKLRGVRFYFNPQLEDVSQKLFSLMIWTGDSLPENLEYQIDSLSPIYSPILNGFRTYTINDTDLVLPAGNIFVGWMQQSNYRINVGFDRNMIANENMFYNILGGGWQQSNLPGAWMIRPVFSEGFLPPDVFSIEENTVMSEFSIFPNPASDEVYIVAMNETGNNNDYQINICNSLGSVVKQVSYLPRSVSISDLAQGFYFINIQNKETQEQRTYKLIISR